jgi:hypothetical protein
MSEDEYRYELERELRGAMLKTDLAYEPSFQRDLLDYMIPPLLRLRERDQSAEPGESGGGEGGERISQVQIRPPNVAIFLHGHPGPAELPIKQVPELKGASRKDLEAVEVLEGGRLLSWPKLDFSLRLGDLIHDP